MDHRFGQLSFFMHLFTRFKEYKSSAASGQSTYTCLLLAIVCPHGGFKICTIGFSDSNKFFQFRPHSVASH